MTRAIENMYWVGNLPGLGNVVERRRLIADEDPEAAPALQGVGGTSPGHSHACHDSAGRQRAIDTVDRAIGAER